MSIITGLLGVFRFGRSKGQGQAAAASLDDVFVMPLASPPAATPEPAAIGQGDDEAQEEAETAPPAEPEGGGDRLDESLRGLFDQGPLIDPNMQNLLAGLEEVDVRVLARDLLAFSRSIGATAAAAGPPARRAPRATPRRR